MAENKSSFILYCDIIHTVNKLSDEKAGVLFKHILSYVNDEDPITDDIIIELVFEPIKQSLKRDLQSWIGTREERSKAGKLGGIKSGESRRKKASEANEANASKTKQTKQSQANEAVSVSVSVSDSVIEKEIYSFDEFWNEYSLKEDKKKCLKVWSKIKSEDKLKIKEHVPKYVLSTPDVQYRKNPFKYLDGECWNNEIKFRGINQNDFVRPPRPSYEHEWNNNTLTWEKLPVIILNDDTILHN